MRRHEELEMCPVCREGDLQEFALRPNELFCPVCREVPLEIEARRAFLGLAVDDKWKCGFCQAQWDVESNGARLEAASHDPFGVAGQFGGQFLPLEQWRAMSNRREHWFECDTCQSQFEIENADALSLKHVGDDPFGAGAAWDKTTLPRTQWARLSRGLAPDAVTHDCPHCAAQWAHDRERHALALVASGRVLPAWAASRMSRPFPISEWMCLAKGKSSPHPGRWCPNSNCRSEWNDDNGGLRLIQSQIANLQKQIGQANTLEGWRRQALGLPTVEQLSRLREEQKQLEQKRAQSQNDVARIKALSRVQMQNELSELLKKSTLEGFVRLQRMTPAKSADDWRHQPGTFVILPLSVARSALHVDEILRWESPAVRCHVEFDRAQNRYKLRRELNGMLVVTESRLQFVNSLDNQPNQVWQMSLKQLRDVERVQAGNSQVIILHSEGASPVGFEVAPIQWTLKDGPDLQPIDVEPEDLQHLLLSLRG